MELKNWDWYKIGFYILLIIWFFTLGYLPYGIVAKDSKLVPMGLYKDRFTKEAYMKMRPFHKKFTDTWDVNIYLNVFIPDGYQFGLVPRLQDGYELGVVPKK